MQIKLVITIILIIGAYALVTKPFQNAKKIKEFVNHFLTAILTYYGTYAVLYMFEVRRDLSIALAGGTAALVLVIINMFFRKPD